MAGKEGSLHSAYHSPKLSEKKELSGLDPGDVKIKMFCRAGPLPQLCRTGRFTQARAQLWKLVEALFQERIFPKSWNSPHTGMQYISVYRHGCVFPSCFATEAS